MPKPSQNLAAIDLNLLTVFRAIEETRHVTKAAKALGVSQPATSHALGRLRDLFGDPLFAKTPRGMVPTPLAESIAPRVRDVLATLERDVFRTRAFVPRELRRTFAIHTTDFVEALVGPRLLRKLGAEAPHVKFAATAVGVALPKEALENGTCDLAIAGFFGALPEGFASAPLFEDSFASAVRVDHPRIRPRTKVSLERFCEERHVLVAPSGELSGAVDRALQRAKKSRTVVAGASGFMVGAWMAATSDCVVTAPSRILRALAEKLSLRVFETPLPLAPIRVVSVWHARNESDAAHAWFRNALREVVSGA